MAGFVSWDERQMDREAYFEGIESFGLLHGVETGGLSLVKSCESFSD